MNKKSNKKTLLQLRQEHHIKQKVLLDLLQCDRKSLYNWEHCRTAPDHWRLRKLCDFYGVKKSDLILAPRYDPYAFLGDKSYEEWKAECEEHKKHMNKWWEINIHEPTQKILNNR